MAMRRMIVRASSWVIWSPTVELPLLEGANAHGPRQTFQLAFPRPLSISRQGDLLPPSPPAEKATARDCIEEAISISLVIFG